MEPAQILREATYLPYLQNIFSFFNILNCQTFTIFLFFVFVNMGPYGGQNSKTLLLPQITWGA